MKYTDYERIKTGAACSVGKFGRDIFAFEILTGIADVPEYHQITEEEFASFDIWKDELTTLLDIKNRPVICSAYAGLGELNEKLLGSY